MILKQGQGHQIWYKLVDPKQGYDSAKIEKHRLNSVRERADDAFLSNQTTRQIPPFSTCESQNCGIVMTCLIYLTILQSFNSI